MKDREQTMLIYIEAFLFLNIMFTLRAANLLLTTFPAPMHQVLWQSCSRWDNLWIAPFKELAGTQTACHDFFFSGHTTVALTNSLLLTKHSQCIERCPGWWILTNYHFKILRRTLVASAWMLFALVIFFLMVLELHYSIDISTAIMLVSLFWHLGQAQIRYEFGFFWWWLRHDKA